MSVASRPVFVEMTPFRIEPQFVGRVWGWKDLRPWYDRTADKEPIGEVWLTGDECTVATGSHRGKTLAALEQFFERLFAIGWMNESRADGWRVELCAAVHKWTTAC